MSPSEPSGDKPYNEPTTSASSKNPFIHFRHYVDEEIAAFRDSILCFPSIFSSYQDHERSCPLDKNRGLKDDGSKWPQESDWERKWGEMDKEWNAHWKRANEDMKEFWGQQIAKAKTEDHEADVQREPKPDKPRVRTWTWSWNWPPKNPKVENGKPEAIEITGNGHGKWVVHTSGNISVDGKEEDGKWIAQSSGSIGLDNDVYKELKKRWTGKEDSPETSKPPLWTWNMSGNWTWPQGDEKQKASTDTSPERDVKRYEPSVPEIHPNQFFKLGKEFKEETEKLEKVINGSILQSNAANEPETTHQHWPLWRRVRQGDEVHKGYENFSPRRPPDRDELPSNPEELFQIWQSRHVPKISRLSQRQTALDYLFLDAYSPIYLESHPRLSQYGSYWREAFEDLVHAERGQQLPERTKQQRSRQAKLDWAFGLVNSMQNLDTKSLGVYYSSPKVQSEEMGSPIAKATACPQYPKKVPIVSFNEDSKDPVPYTPGGDAKQLGTWGSDEDIDKAYPDFTSSSPEANKQGERHKEISSWSLDGIEKAFLDSTNATNSPGVELDMYEQFLRKQSYPSTTTITTTSSATQTAPSILSTLTTTERTVQPSGVVTTKVVLKKRFSDGREETSETIHTDQNCKTQETIQHCQPAQEQHTLQKPPNQEQDQPHPNRGWFWSS